MNVNATLLEELPGNSRLLLYGACEFGRFVLERLSQRADAGLQVVGFIDGLKTGTYCGLPIVAPADLPGKPLGYDQIILTLGSYRQAIRALEQAGVADCHLLYVERELFRVEENRAKPDAVENLNKKIDYLEWMLTKRTKQHEAALELLYGAPVLPPAPLNVIPENMLAAFTMQGRVKITEEYFNATRPTNHPVIYTDREINSYVAMIREKKSAYYETTDEWMYQAIEKYPLSGMNVLIIGSNCPWYEAMCIANNAKPHVVDYGNIVTTSQRIRVVPAEEAWSKTAFYDACLSISSIEHDGLGAYGDPLNPDSDLETMTRTMQVLKPGGLLFLSMPVGADRVRFNHCRVYGPLRLARVMEGWTRKDSFGFSEDLLETAGDVQPVFILEKPAT